MKTRVNLTIEDSLLISTKIYAQKQQTSVSELVENYFKMITDLPKKNNIVNMVESLPKPAIDADVDLKQLYYMDKAEKYGF